MWWDVNYDHILRVDPSARPLGAPKLFTQTGDCCCQTRSGRLPHGGWELRPSWVDCPLQPFHNPAPAWLLITVGVSAIFHALGQPGHAGYAEQKAEAQPQQLSTVRKRL